MEEWKELEEHPGYQVSNTGRVRSMDRYIQGKGNSLRFFPGRELHQRINTSGYFDTAITKKRYCVHTLVAKAFVENKNGGLQVNHIDENKLNNRADNLEWCTQAHNNAHGTRMSRIALAVGCPVTATNIVSGFVERYNTITEAVRQIHAEKRGIKRAVASGKPYHGRTWAQLRVSPKRAVDLLDESGIVAQHFQSISDAGAVMGINENAIWRACNGRTKRAGGLHWKYA